MEEMTTSNNAAQARVLPAPQLRRDGTSSLKAFNRTLMNTDMQAYLHTVLGSRKEQFVNNLLAVVGNDVKLQGCTPTSLIYAAIKATALGLPLDPNLGFAYIIPYNNTKKIREMQLIASTDGGDPVEQEVTVEVSLKEAQFQIGYKGFVQLAIRTGQFRTINVTEIRAGELGKKNLITGEIEIREVENRNEQPVIGYLAYFELSNGFNKMAFMSTDEIKTHALKYSQTFSSKYDNIRSKSKWTTDFEAMAHKTVLKLLLSKYAPLSTDMQGATELKDALRSDQAVIDDRGNPDYVDNQADDQADVTPASIEERKQEMRQHGSGAPELM